VTRGVGDCVAVFIFQSVPERYDLSEIIKPGERDTWYATRYRGEMHPGDPVFFWMAGAPPTRGLYGWGRIASEPYLKAGWDSHGVDVIYEVRFKQHISAGSVRADPRLSELLIFRAPQSTNFLLPTDQAERLVEFVRERGEKAPLAVA
jgi:hypothetical protein